MVPSTHLMDDMLIDEECTKGHVHSHVCICVVDKLHYYVYYEYVYKLEKIIIS